MPQAVAECQCKAIHATEKQTCQVYPSSLILFVCFFVCLFVLLIVCPLLDPLEIACVVLLRHLDPPQAPREVRDKTHLLFSPEDA